MPWESIPSLSAVMSTSAQVAASAAGTPAATNWQTNLPQSLPLVLKGDHNGLAVRQEPLDALWPLHNRYGIGSKQKILDSKGQGRLFVVDAVHVQMKEEMVLWQPVFLHNRERGTGNGLRHPEATRDSTA